MTSDHAVQPMRARWRPPPYHYRVAGRILACGCGARPWANVAVSARQQRSAEQPSRPRHHRKLYGGGGEMPLIQEIALGIGGWRLVEVVRPEIDVCHLDGGHAAFAVLERARSLASRMGISFPAAMWATRAGNVFTTHTPVTAGFDRFPLELLGQSRPSLTEAGIERAYVLGLGRAVEAGNAGPLSMAYLAARRAVQLRRQPAARQCKSSHFPVTLPRWPETRSPSAMSRTACMSLHGIRRLPTRSGPTPAARIAGGPCRTTCTRVRLLCRTSRFGRCEAKPGRTS